MSEDSMGCAVVAVALAFVGFGFIGFIGGRGSIEVPPRTHVAVCAREYARARTAADSLAVARDTTIPSIRCEVPT